MVGQSFVGTPCKKDQNCGYCEDNGLEMGLVVAHQIGHLQVFILSLFQFFLSYIFVGWVPWMMIPNCQGASPKTLLMVVRTLCHPTPICRLSDGRNAAKRPLLNCFSVCLSSLVV